MKIYNSFLIRCWLIGLDRSVFEVEHIQTGERKRVASFTEVQSLLLSALLAERESVTQEGENDK
ncbi:MAG TPA: hypothetical protein VLR90_23195 [Blastocatellia bacterium]|nr:hypothetical protein [Blastocatellia bacterium]